MPEHSYPVGELPALCTPRMYRALHDHTSRSYVVGPPQFTPGGVKDLISESARIRGKTDFRKLRLPQLDKLPMDRPDTVTKNDPIMADLLDRLGLTPRRPVKGHFGSCYQPKQGKKSGGQEGSDRNCTITKNVRKVSGHDNNAFEWLESSIADANLPKTARTRFTTAESSIADANLPKTARTRFTTADTRPWS